MIEVVQALDRTPIARLDSDDAAALERKIDAASKVFADRRPAPRDRIPTKPRAKR